MLVFDSAALPVRERYGVITDTITTAASATFMAPTRGGESLHLRMHAWELGGVEVVDTQCSAHTLRRTGRQSSDDEPTYAITCGLRGRGAHQQLDREMQVRPATVWATDLSQPYVHHVTDTWTTTAKVPSRLLGIPPSVVTPALHHIGASPLAPLFSHHMAEVRQIAGDVNDVAAASLGTARLALARALVASVSGRDGSARSSWKTHCCCVGRPTFAPTSPSPISTHAPSPQRTTCPFDTCTRRVLRLTCTLSSGSSRKG